MRLLKFKNVAKLLSYANFYLALHLRDLGWKKAVKLV